MTTPSVRDCTLHPTYHRKIVSVAHLRQALVGLCGGDSPPGRTKTVVQCHGCFDIVHPGHIRYLQFARTQGDVLVVSITGDAAIDKGEMRPYIPQELRAENLAALEFVDFVVVDGNPTARELLDQIRPDVYVKGEEYATSHDPRFLAEREIVESHGGRVIFSSGQVVFSSTRLMEALARSPELDAQRLSAVCRRHDISIGALRHIIGGMNNLKVVVFGDSLIERYILCDAGEIASEAPMMALAELDSEDYLGGAANVALQSAVLGASVILITGTGADAGSEWMRETLTSFGVSILPIQHRSAAPVHARFLVDDRKLLKVNRGGARPLDSLAERRTADLLGEAATAADVVITLDCGYGLITPGLISRVGDQLRRAPLLTLGTGQPRGDLSAFRDVDLICCSERRLRAATNDASAGLSSLAYNLMQRNQTRSMLLTLGKRGLVTFDRRTHDRSIPSWHDRLCSEHLPSFATHVADRLGIAEAVLTMASLVLAAGGTLMQAAYMASVIAAVRIAAVGTVPATIHELQAWLKGRVELSSREQRLIAPARQAPARLHHVQAST